MLLHTSMLSSMVKQTRLNAPKTHFPVNSQEPKAQALLRRALW